MYSFFCSFLYFSFYLSIDLSIYTHTNKSKCKYVLKCIFVDIPTYVHILHIPNAFSIFLYIHTYIQTQTNICANKFIFYIYICIYIYIAIYIYIYIYIHIYIYIYIYIYISFKKNNETGHIGL